MSEVSRGRLAIDFDEIERHLRAPAPAKDPLAELARIVGQDDPFRTLLAEPGPAERPATGRTADEVRAPTFADHLDAETAEHGPDAHDEDDAPFAAEPRRSRKGLIAVGAVLGVAVMGVAGALALRGTAGPVGNGEPPIIQADRSPSKVLPPNPGGVEIPNQDRQILERGADRQTKVVNREEQPVDVRQAARVASAGGDLVPSGLPTPSAPGSAMGPQTAAAAIGIEPKKVRTVTVRPDGSIGAPEPARSASPAPTLASLAAGGPAITSSTNPPASRPRADGPTATPGATAAAPRATTGAAESATTTAAAPLPARPQRVASVTPMAPVAAAEPTVQPAPAAAGTFSVQLTTSDSESGGRAAFKALQQKHASELGSRSALIRKHEAEGKTVFRVRVGPMSKDEATGLCTRLKAAGGACFVAGA